MNHHCPLCDKRIAKPTTQARAHLRSAHSDQKHYASVQRYLRSIGVPVFHRPFQRTPDYKKEPVFSAMEGGVE